ncbi:HET-domain-containing protein [Hypoxylon fuscum]|nr:HET-domain-containing protein [Hypoxylon fuscum]
MRLLNANSLKLYEFEGNDIPKYAILSHTWAEGEVSLQDLQAGIGPDKAGYVKIDHTCKLAIRHRMEWAWIDTCCIDKSSSAELSEAINSMYKWYQQSGLCYVYLADVDSDEQFPYAACSTDSGDERRISRWFTRAWTLQELIAPREVVFYDREWRKIETSHERVAEIISEITVIPMPIISGTESPAQYSVAQKMSWAAYRSSTRLEDRAYSLMGLFDINMPLLYGEGDRAFTRLQEEILKETDDHSLLCWTVPKDSPRSWSLESVFAKSPDDFARSGNIRGNLFDSGTPSAVTNRGLQVHLCLTERRYETNSHLYHGNLACSVYDAALNAAEHDSTIAAHQVSIVLIGTPQITSRHSMSINRFARFATPTLGRIRLEGTHFTEMLRVLESQKLIYIHKTLFSWEKYRFSIGAVHLQNIPIAKALSPLSTTIKHELGSYEISTIFYHGLKKRLRGNGTVDIASNPINQYMAWAPFYGCVLIGTESRSFPMYINIMMSMSGQKVYLPQFIAFGLESPSNRAKYRILVIWNDTHIHFSLRRGKFILPKSTVVSSVEQITKKWAALLDPLDPETYRGDIWNMYGEIGRTRAVIEGRDIELVLEREDPNTAAGEAAGNRFHLLISVSSNTTENVGVVAEDTYSSEESFVMADRSLEMVTN